MPRSRCLSFVLAFAVAGCTPAQEPGIVERDDLRSVFVDAGVTGTFALRERPGGPLTVVDRARAERPIAPESTYKLAHGMLANDSGAVTDVDTQVLPYGGGDQPVDGWERDMPMRQAVVESNAAVFVQLAGRIGARREQEWLDRLGYGNRTIGGRPDRFWLGGPLEISPVAQTEFLMRLATRSLPVSRAAQDTVADIVASPTTPGLHAKSGWRFDSDPQIGWWVGWVQRPDGSVAAFAMVIDMDGAADAALREPLARTLLTRLEVL